MQKDVAKHICLAQVATLHLPAHGDSHSAVIKSLDSSFNVTSAGEVHGALSYDQKKLENRRDVLHTQKKSARGMLSLSSFQLWP